MQLTDPQRRTLQLLIGTGDRPMFPADLAQRLRDRIEAPARSLDLPETLWLGKEKLNDLGRCEGAFSSKIAGEAPPFEHGRASATGVLQHRAIEVVVGARDPIDPHTAAELSVRRTVEKEERFADYWAGLQPSDRDDIQMEVVRRTILFEGSFPPLRELRRELTPATELSVRAELLGGALVVSGKLDLLLGAPDRLEPMRATRIAIDLKTGGAYPQYAEDNRLYALVLALRFGVPPFRVASFFLEGGTWQAEDVDEGTLFHAADRVVEAARSAAAIHNGREPALTAGPWCGWCPRLHVCPAADPDVRSTAPESSRVALLATEP
ncbi:MAG TPA: PD-(D/E)XK nuclease family protein [Actinomycetota bacterium]